MTKRQQAITLISENWEKNLSKGAQGMAGLWAVTYLVELMILIDQLDENTLNNFLDGIKGDPGMPDVLFKDIQRLFDIIKGNNPLLDTNNNQN